MKVDIAEDPTLRRTLRCGGDPGTLGEHEEIQDGRTKGIVILYLVVFCLSKIIGKRNKDLL